jgi:hypothetical protein
MKKKSLFPNKRKLKRKAAAAAAGVVAACSIGLASVSPAASDLFGENAVPADTAVQTDKQNASSPSASPNSADRLRARIRGVFLAQPSVLRGVILLPFWSLGKVLLTLFAGLFTALAPVWQAALGVLLNAALLFVLITGVYKLIFPNKELKDLLTKRNILLLSGAAVLLAAADALLRVYWDDYQPVSIAVKLALGLVVLILLSWRIYGKRRPRPKAVSAANA